MRPAVRPGRYRVRIPGYDRPQLVEVVRAGRGFAFRSVSGIGGLVGPVSRVGRFEIVERLSR